MSLARSPPAASDVRGGHAGRSDVRRQWRVAWITDAATEAHAPAAASGLEISLQRVGVALSLK
jgi:hypothetical protein